MKSQCLRKTPLVVVLLATLAGTAFCEEPQPDSGPYLQSVRRFADTVIDRGRDTYGKDTTPLFVDGLHVETLEPVRWKGPQRTWVLSNFASVQPLLRTLDGLTALTGQKQYRQAAEDATRYALGHLVTPNGLLYWGGHMAWDLDQDQAVWQYADAHEVKGHQPYYRLMWRVDAPATARLTEAIWAGHILDWSLLDYNRHASVRTDRRPKWDSPFDENAEVPFPAAGGNLSFANVTPPLLHSGVMLAVLGEDADALTWTRRLIRRWQQARHPETGLCGGQLSYRQQDRAREALGHVHPTINEAKIVASYHQVSRYHHLPLAQMQAAETLVASGGAYAEVGREFLQWASSDLKAYARHGYDPATGRFVGLMTDGTPLQWQQARTGYYVAESFAPRKPDGFLLWGYALAYRLTGDEAHWRMVREIGRQFDLGDVGQPDGNERSLHGDTTCTDWRAIYALLECYRATQDRGLLHHACRIADNLLKTQTPTGLFPRPSRSHARTGDEVPLALLHLAATIDGKGALLPAPVFDRRFFHCQYHGPLEKHQQKRADARTYDNSVFYGDP